MSVFLKHEIQALAVERLSGDLVREREISDDAATSYSQVYVRATELIRRTYSLKDGRCDALDQLDALEAAREDDPAAAW